MCLSEVGASPPCSLVLGRVGPGGGWAGGRARASCGVSEAGSGATKIVAVESQKGRVPLSNLSNCIFTDAWYQAPDEVLGRIHKAASRGTNVWKLQRSLLPKSKGPV